MTSPQQRQTPADRSMAGKTVVMTGATSGLGAVAAGDLADKGAKLVLIARDRARGERSLAVVRARNPQVEHQLHFADLSRLDAIRSVAGAIAAAETRIDVLVNNAGAIFSNRAVTPDGLERTFATNHMAYFLLTLLLREPLAAATDARVVSTASAAHRLSRYDPDDPQTLRHYNALRAYGRSKLYNILFTRELARRWAPLGITANCHHPGFVATRFGDTSGAWLAPLAGLAKLFAIPPAEGARTLVHLAASPAVQGISGRYFDRCRAIAPTAAAEDDKAAAQLWALSLSLAGLTA